MLILTGKMCQAKLMLQYLTYRSSVTTYQNITDITKNTGKIRKLYKKYHTLKLTKFTLNKRTIESNYVISKYNKNHMEIE